MRLSPDDLDLVDRLRGSAGGGVSRAEVLRALVRQQRRALVDEQIAAAYDAAGPGDTDLGLAGAALAGRALRDL